MNTDTLTVVAPMSFWGTGVHALGLAILEETFRLAAHAYRASTNPAAPEVVQAVCFLQGTGLEVLLHTFTVSEYYPERLRTSFFAQWRSPKSL